MEIIIVSLFFLIIFVLVILAAVGSYREKQKRKALDFEKDALYIETKSDLNRMMIKLGLYFEMLEEFLENHDPLKGKYSLSQINSFGASMLQEIRESEQLKNIFKDELRRQELKTYLDELGNNKPSNWSRDVYESYNIINAKAHVYINKTDNANLVKEIKEENEKAFTEYISNH